MPVFNKARFVAEAIESVLAQTYRNIELIVADNQSTDGSADICREFARRDTRVRFIEQPRNIGMIDNFDFVLGQASGEYFAWVSADDRVDPEWLQILRLALVGNVVNSFGRLVNIDQAGSPVREVPVRVYRQGKMLRLTRHFWAREGDCNYLHGLMRTATVRSIGGIAAYRRAGMGFDALFVRRCLYEGHMVATPDVAFYKRLPPADPRPARQMVRRALNPTIPIRPVLLLYSVDRGIAQRVVFGLMLLPRILWSLSDWYGRGAIRLWRARNRAD